MNTLPLLAEFRSLIAEAHQKADDPKTHALLDWLYQQMISHAEQLEVNHVLETHSPQSQTQES